MHDTKNNAPLLAKLKPSDQTPLFLKHYQQGCKDLVVIDPRGLLLRREYSPELLANSPKAKIYYTLNVVSPDFKRIKPTKADMSYLQAWGADVDPNPEFEKTPDPEVFKTYHIKDVLKHPDKKYLRQLAYIMQEIVHPAAQGKRGVAPTLIVFSGRGVQFIWYADKRYKASEKNIDYWEGLGRSIIATIGGDAVQNVDRLLRLPGTMNDRRGLQARIIWEASVAYTPKQIISGFGPAPDKVIDNRGGVVPTEFKYVDWDAVFSTVELLDLDDSLVTRFTRDLKLSTDLSNLYSGVALPDMRDTTGSAFDINLLGALKRRGYEPQDAFQIAMTYDHGSGHKHADNKNARHFMRCWARTVETSPKEDFADIPAEETVEDSTVLTHRNAVKAEKDIKDNYIYVATADRVIHVRSGLYFEPKGFNTKYGTTHTGRPDEPQFAHKVLVSTGRQVDKVTWAPGKDKIFKKQGMNYYNMYQKRRPSKGIDFVKGCTAPFHKVMRWVIPVGVAVEYFWDYCAYTVQHPETKINHHPLMYSVMEGVGKDTLLAAVRFAVGEANSSETTLKDLTGNFNAALMYKKLVVINEVESFKQGKEVANILKPLLAAPPDTIAINAKYQPQFDQPNLFSVIMTSNSTRPMHVAGVDRRITPIHCREEKMPVAMSEEIWGWLKDGGLKLLHHELMHRDVSGFNPNVRPDNVDLMGAHLEMQEESRSNSEVLVEEFINNGEDVFDRDVVLLNKIQEFTESRRLGNINTVQSAMRTAGGLKLSRISVRLADGKVRKYTMWVIRHHDKYGFEKSPGILEKYAHISGHDLYNIATGVTDFDGLPEDDGEDLI